MTVEDVMTKEVITVGPETPLKDVARTLAVNEISGVPVVDDGVVVGVVSETDLVRVSSPEPKPRTRGACSLTTKTTPPSRTAWRGQRPRR
jgi:CBS domain-containing protein